MNHALLVEDNRTHAELIGDEVEAALPGWVIDVTPTVAGARRLLGSRQYQLFIFDYRLPDGDGLELLREIRSVDDETPVLFVTTASSAKLAVEAMKLGADDYVVKEEGYLSVLPFVVKEALARRRLARERRELDERLLRAERGATLGYVASGLAHHINNPLTTIRTFLQLLPTHINDPEFRGPYLQMTLAEIERLRNFVQDIMKAVEVPPGGPFAQDLGEILTRAEEEVAPELKKKSLVFRKDLPVVVPRVCVHGQATTLLFLTLFQNAARFSPEGGRIEVEARIDREAKRLVAKVRDQGPGIPPEHREKIFEPFFTTAVDGLGMGLFVASRIADLQNIQLTVEGAAASGAVFRVGLPLVNDEPESDDLAIDVTS